MPIFHTIETGSVDTSDLLKKDLSNIGNSQVPIDNMTETINRLSIVEKDLTVSVPVFNKISDTIYYTDQDFLASQNRSGITMRREYDKLILNGSVRKFQSGGYTTGFPSSFSEIIFYIPKVFQISSTQAVNVGGYSNAFSDNTTEPNKIAPIVFNTFNQVVFAGGDAITLNGSPHGIDLIFFDQTKVTIDPPNLYNNAILAKNEIFEFMTIQLFSQTILNDNSIVFKNTSTFLPEGFSDELYGNSYLVQMRMTGSDGTGNSSTVDSGNPFMWGLNCLFILSLNNAGNDSDGNPVVPIASSFSFDVMENGEPSLHLVTNNGTAGYEYAVMLKFASVYDASVNERFRFDVKMKKLYF